jgi:broad specificity phosphatase PhoE
MVHVLFVRHGESNGNVRSAQMAIKIAKGLIATEKEAEEEHKLVRASLDDAEASGDPQLTQRHLGGEAQARMFEKYWAPILEERVHDGEVSVFVSPMRRCLQTADPFMKRLGLKGIVHSKIFEVPGLCDRHDQEFMERNVFSELQNNDIDSALKLVRNHRFRRCGMTASEIRRSFPWATEFEGGGFSRHDPWWRGGFESERETNTRIQYICDWLFDLARRFKPNHVVMLFSHGDTIWRSVCALLKLQSQEIGHSLQNTSVTHLRLVPSAETGISVSCKFLNRCPHLLSLEDDKLSKQFYRFQGLMKRKMRKGKKQKDLTGLMLRSTRRLRPLLAKL